MATPYLKPCRVSRPLLTEPYGKKHKPRPTKDGFISESKIMAIVGKDNVVSYKSCPAGLYPGPRTIVPMDTSIPLTFSLELLRKYTDEGDKFFLFQAPGALTIRGMMKSFPESFSNSKLDDAIIEEDLDFSVEGLVPGEWYWFMFSCEPTLNIQCEKLSAIEIIFAYLSHHNKTGDNIFGSEYLTCQLAGEETQNVVLRLRNGVVTIMAYPSEILGEDRPYVFGRIL